MTSEQLVLAEMQEVKVRLGSINNAGQQKGVDSLLVTDLIDLARNHAIADAVILTGDGDMRIAVQIAQSFGVRVHLLGLEPSSASQSVLLRQESDTVSEVSRADVAKFMTHSMPSLAPGLIPTLVASSPMALPLDRESQFTDAVSRALQEIFKAATADDMKVLQAVLVSTGQIPAQYDGRILGTCRAKLGRNLEVDERRLMRDKAAAFIKAFEATN
jgi:hypothetical protein